MMIDKTQSLLVDHPDGTIHFKKSLPEEHNEALIIQQLSQDGEMWPHFCVFSVCLCMYVCHQTTNQQIDKPQAKIEQFYRFHVMQYN